MKTECKYFGEEVSLLRLNCGADDDTLEVATRKS